MILLRGARLVKSRYTPLYLSTLRLWFEQFPLSLKQREQLRTRLESRRDDKSNREARRMPSFNYDIEQSVRSMNEMDAFIKATGAQL